MTSPDPSSDPLHGLRTVVGAPDLADDALTLDPRVGAVAVADTDLPAVPEGSALPLTIVATGGAAQLDGPLRLAARRGLRVVGVRTSLRDLSDPAGNVRRVVAAVDALREAGLATPDDLLVTVVLPDDLPEHGRDAVLDELSYAELVAGVPAPTGRGTDPASWARTVDAALDREVPVESVLAPATGTPGGGADPAGVLAAVRACLDGDAAAAAQLLGVDEAAALGAYDADTLARTRRWCRRVDVAAG
ncbi:hypothetical protein RDV89_03260 [Nocardioides zeae]|uniref:Uncharacterized protein n=1 Tax=Nocardioides imazamoxiresistens TaxID=3231893 RepID=A0ABU3PS63_9ACTN|nr:hypothetical protein [Nocardioides zeae]MDT9592067.1 hypothetical protein [Nocardioides zeae]